MHAMSLERIPREPVTPSDRLAATLCIAIILHAMLVLGITFTPEPQTRRTAEGLEITLVAQKSAARPSHAELLAQANAEGGGTALGKARPATPLSTPLPAPIPAFAATPVPRQTAATAQTRLPLDPLPPTPARQKITEAAIKPTPSPTRLLKPAKTAKVPLTSPHAQQADTDPAPAEPAPTSTPPVEAPEALPTAAQLITRSFAMASLHAELEQRLDMKAQRPRLKFVSASTQEYRYAAYMEAWRAKVERIGNLNYPDEARQKKLSGALLLDVALRPDGSVLEIIVRRSSGHKVLDDAAVRIVELAGPYAEFPDEIHHDVDILHITRTWKFLSNESFTAQ